MVFFAEGPARLRQSQMYDRHYWCIDARYSSENRQLLLQWKRCNLCS